MTDKLPSIDDFYEELPSKDEVIKEEKLPSINEFVEEEEEEVVEEKISVKKENISVMMNKNVNLSQKELRLGMMVF